jgi:hypothetical protein
MQRKSSKSSINTSSRLLSRWDIFWSLKLLLRISGRWHYSNQFISSYQISWVQKTLPMIRSKPQTPILRTRKSWRRQLVPSAASPGKERPTSVKCHFHVSRPGLSMDLVFFGWMHPIEQWGVWCASITACMSCAVQPYICLSLTKTRSNHFFRVFDLTALIAQCKNTEVG